MTFGSGLVVLLPPCLHALFFCCSPFLPFNAARTTPTLPNPWECKTTTTAPPTIKKPTYLNAFVLHFYYTYTVAHKQKFVLRFLSRTDRAKKLLPQAAATPPICPITSPHPTGLLQPNIRWANCFNWSRWCYLYKCLPFLFVRPVCISFFWQFKL